MLRVSGGQELDPLVRRALFWYTENVPRSISVIPKKRGRPATGRDPVIPVRLPPKMIEQLEELAARRKATRSQVIREFLRKALVKRSK